MSITVSDDESEVLVSPAYLNLPPTELSVLDKVNPVRVITPPFVTDDSLHLAYSGSAVWAMSFPPALQVHRHNVPVKRFELLSQFDWSSTGPFGLHFLARDTGCCLAVGTKLSCFSDTENSDSIEFDDPICHLTGSVPRTLSRVAAFFERGGAVCWPQHFELLPKNLELPDGVFLRNGQLIIRAEGEWSVWSTEARKLTHIAQIEGIEISPKFILRHPDPNKIAPLPPPAT